MIEIEERKQANKEFRKLRDVFPQYMCVYASDGSPLYANGGLLDYFGFTLEECLDQNSIKKKIHRTTWRVI